jgi:hypothetical protein|nr:MAG TPA: hypothetical protein [Caudoviricetes sp.]
MTDFNGNLDITKFNQAYKIVNKIQGFSKNSAFEFIDFIQSEYISGNKNND